MFAYVGPRCASAVHLHDVEILNLHAAVTTHTGASTTSASLAQDLLTVLLVVLACCLALSLLARSLGVVLTGAGYSLAVFSLYWA